MKLLTICALVALMLVAVSPEANGKGGVVITTCNQTVMTNAVLGLDLVCPGSGITAAASGITIDLGGHTLRGTNPGVSFGVFVTAPDHVTVKNGVVRGFSDGITNISTGTDHLSVSNVVVSGNGTGINIGGDSPSVSKANASGNGGYGILVAGDGASVKSSTANGNGGSGIWAQPISSNNNVKFSSLTASGNGLTGIQIDGNGGSVKSSTAFGNGDLGIEINGEAAKVNGNHASGNGYGTKDLSGLGISVVYVTTPPVGKNIALGNDELNECNPGYLC